MEQEQETTGTEHGISVQCRYPKSWSKEKNYSNTHKSVTCRKKSVRVNANVLIDAWAAEGDTIVPDQEESEMSVAGSTADCCWWNRMEMQI